MRTLFLMTQNLYSQEYLTFYELSRCILVVVIIL